MDVIDAIHVTTRTDGRQHEDVDKTNMPALAHKIGSLLFCPRCGTLLALPQGDAQVVTCELCRHEEPASSYENTEIVTRSHPDAFPSALRQKRKTQTKTHEGKVLPKVTEKCPSCGHLEAFYEEKQMRSADEGSTILYTCVSCKHGWRINN